MVTEAVAALSTRKQTATVNAIAEEIGIDQSGASRLVKSAAEAGYLEPRDSPADSRRRQVTLTPRGHTVLKQAHAWQEHVFMELTPEWSQQRRDDFQTAMADLIARSQTITSPASSRQREE